MSSSIGRQLEAVEPERYEFAEKPLYDFGFARREFLKSMGGGIAVFLLVRKTAAFQESGAGRGFRGEELPREMGAWLQIAENGAVTVYTGKVEMGQNIRTSLTQAVAEELNSPLASISLVMGDTSLVPFDMGTFGSRTTPTMNLELRRVASVARETLVDMAAKTWGVDPGWLVASDGAVRDRKSGRVLEYGRLAQGQSLAKAVIESDPLTPATEWRVAGKPVPKVDGRDFVTGKHKYTPDLELPGLLHGKVLRPPSFGAELASVDIRQARAMPEITVIHDGDFVGVAAPSAEAADRALGAIHAQWKETPQPSSRQIFEYLKSHAEGSDDGRESSAHTAGSVNQGLAAAANRLAATYTVAYIAHAPLEPRAAVAEWKDGKLTVHTGTQRPFAVRDDLAQAFHISADQVRVLVPDTGSAYGGKHTGEAALEAARLARAAGAPVKRVWTREEELTWAYFRPAGVIEIKSGLRADGTISAWEFHNYNSGESGIGTPYNIANQRIQFHPCDSPLRQGSYRGLAATANQFARESHMDELARVAKLDPLEFRRRNLTDARLRVVFDAAAEKFGWGQVKPAPGHGFGIGGGVEKGGYVATCAEVSVDRASGAVRVVRLVTAFECGAVVNPDGLRNQIAGANVMGLGGALFEAIEFENGKILTNRFSRYRVPRFSDAPAVEVVIVDRKDLPSAGAGETPIMAVAPAIGNAVFDASGVRLRSLPMAPGGLKA
ncbi:MAG TPA: molybdopterin cofactor-binding domain-containing protein [Terriglobia bacterium]